jgi:hypothetical protein
VIPFIKILPLNKSGLINKAKASFQFYLVSYLHMRVKVTYSIAKTCRAAVWESGSEWYAANTWKNTNLNFILIIWLSKAAFKCGIVYHLAVHIDYTLKHVWLHLSLKLSGVLLIDSIKLGYCLLDKVLRHL